MLSRARDLLMVGFVLALLAACYVVGGGVHTAYAIRSWTRKALLFVKAAFELAVAVFVLVVIMLFFHEALEKTPEME